MDGTLARTPEELETLLEDAFVLRDNAAVAALFTPSGVLIADDHGDIGGIAIRARGPAAIGRLAGRLWRHSYVADARRVLQVGDIALIVNNGALAPRHSDGPARPTT